jgi:hypothetical protein
MFLELGLERLNIGDLKFVLISWIEGLLSSVSSFFGQEGDNEAF